MQEKKIDPLPRGGPSLTAPNATSQFTRFKPKLDRLDQQFAENISLSDSVDGASPERILVLEVAGSVKEFANALQKVEGFEYLNSFLTDDYVEEESVYTGKGEKVKLVKREVFLTMSNLDGLRRLVSHWKKISDTGNADYGFAPLRDALPLENHEALSNRIVVEDPDDFSDIYESPLEQMHGTAMASLIIHGDRNAKDRPLDSFLYVRPILAPGNPGFDGKRRECIPEGVLPLDLIHRSVKRMFDGDGGEDPTAPNVQVINLSVCDPRQLFDRNLSPWARMLDWLSYKYNVLFIVSAGNHLDDIELSITNGEFSALSGVDREKLIVKELSQSRWAKRIMAPAESLNAITVKSTHHDHFEGEPTHPDIIDPFKTDLMFSPINPVSLGKANGIKPELMASGGRVTYKNAAFLDSENVRLKIVNTPKPFGPGHKVAIVSKTAGVINAYGYSYGTSNAAALATRRAALLHESVRSMREFEQEGSLDNAPESLILKALLVHGAEMPSEATALFKELFKTEKNSKTFKGEQSHYFGYGSLQEQRIHACAPNQATLIRTGKLLQDQSDIYSFPLPPCLSSVKEERRMIVTLAWFAPINPLHNEYIQAQMWVSDPKKTSPLNFSDGDYYHHHQKKGTVFHDIVRGDKASPYLHGDECKIRVNCKARAGGKGLEIPYALVVTLDTTNQSLPVYGEVKSILDQKLTQSADISG
tara:strand:- start:680 stop:2788 length:2109 start_codon:yes stop_codon:yes gene_type:complete